MNKKGFTLIELLAVLGLLTIIALLGVPVLLNQIESQKKKNYENFVGDLCLSAEAYINHSNDIEGIESFKEPGDVLSIKMEDLIVNNYVKSNTKNPKTKEKIKATDTIIVTINENKTYDCSLNNEVITVTFDANGGELSNNTKNVVVGSSYGTLPTPTRDGYTFKGWNGKNKAIISEYKQGATENNNIINLDASFVSENSCSAIQTQTRLNETFVGSNVTHRDMGSKSVEFIKDDSYNLIYLKINGTKKDSGIYFGNNMENGKKYILSFNIDSFNSTGCKAIITKLQLEEGDTVTEYEPYYIQKSTKVVQNKNHTLKAIWEKN